MNYSITTYITITLFILFLVVLYLQIIFHPYIFNNISETSWKKQLKKLITLEIMYYLLGFTYLLSLIPLQEHIFIKVVMSATPILALLSKLNKGKLFDLIKDLSVEPKTVKANFNLNVKSLNSRSSPLRYYVIYKDELNKEQKIEISPNKYKEIVLLDKTHLSRFDEKVELEKSYRGKIFQTLTVKYLPNSSIAIDVKINTT